MTKNYAMIRSTQAHLEEANPVGKFVLRFPEICDVSRFAESFANAKLNVSKDRIVSDQFICFG
jgi:hypothetical protein